MKSITNSLKLYQCIYNGITREIYAANERTAQMHMATGLVNPWTSKNANKVIVKEIK